MVATDLCHPPDHAAAQTLAAILGCDQDLQRTEHVRLGCALRKPRFDNGVDTSVREVRDDPVPRCRNRVAPAHDLIALVVPHVEEELRVLGDHPAEEAIKDLVVVHELGPDLLLEAGDMGLLAGPLGTCRKVQRHVGAEPRISELTSPPRRGYRPTQATLRNARPSWCCTTDG